jgi:hypothetical protein
VPQVLPQQRDGPFDRLIAERLRAPVEGGDESRPEFVGPQAGVVAPALVGQGRRVSGLLIARDPVVDAHATGAEHAGNLGNRAAGGGFQDSQGAAEEADIRGAAQLLFKAAPLGGGQLPIAHGTLGGSERTTTG